MSWEKELIDKANEIIELYPEKRSALGPLLYLAQEKDGYISNDSIVYDIGCSTGSLIAKLSNYHKNKDCINFIGIA